MQQKKETAIRPTREEDYPEWYQQVVKAADLAESSPVRGCMVIKPWGWSIWEAIRDRLDLRIKETGHQNAYFPLFIPMSYLEREAEHVKGFAKECAVVTHHRLEEKDGKLTIAGPLEEPLIVRPTSETIIGDAFSRWVSSWRDLPLLINQWANVVRWEMRTRLFLRTTEFLWQEGHTVHATEQEAREETMKMLDVYREVVEEWLAVPVIVGEKTPQERFPGAVNTYTIEAMMQDRKALQGGTSHYLGQNFAKAFNIRFNTKEGALEYGYTTSWGITTRLIGALIMTHADDDGLRLPPRVAPHHVVIIPMLTKPERHADVLAFAEKIKKGLAEHEYAGRKITAHIDTRDLRGGEKNWEWIKKGVPIRLEVGARDVDGGVCVVSKRDGSMHKETMNVEHFIASAGQILDEMQRSMYEEALSFRKKYTREDITTLEELRQFFTPKNEAKPEIHGGFVLAKWSGDPKSEELLEEMKLSIRCIPLEQRNTEGKCLFTGKPARSDVIIAKSY
jgi:prolyl-tRNA synthetase